MTPDTNILGLSNEQLQDPNELFLRCKDGFKEFFPEINLRKFQPVGLIIDFDHNKKPYVQVLLKREDDGQKLVLTKRGHYPAKDCGMDISVDWRSQHPKERYEFLSLEAMKDNSPNDLRSRQGEWFIQFSDGLRNTLDSDSLPDQIFEELANGGNDADFRYMMAQVLAEGIKNAYENHK